jgi:hypothetical protein
MKFLLFAQHGWADDHRGMVRCSRLLGVENAIAPNLGWWQTWRRIAPLIKQVEEVAQSQLKAYPRLPWRIVGHSMGGLIWLELLHRYPEWHDRVESLVLLGSPVGGAELGRMLDPLNLAIGSDLAVNRRPIAEAIAQKIPTLSIAGDIDGGSDGVVTVGSTQFNYAQCQNLPNIFHPDLRFDARVITAIHNFWSAPFISQIDRDLQQQLIDYLRSIPSIIDGHYRDFDRAKVVYQFNQDLILKQWRNPLGFSHVYLGKQNQCLFAGYVSWLDRQKLARSIGQIPHKFGDYLLKN